MFLKLSLMENLAFYDLKLVKSIIFYFWIKNMYMYHNFLSKFSLSKYLQNSR